MLSPDYFDKLPKLTYLSPRELSSAARRDLQHLQSMHVPPSRPQLIPMCPYKPNGDAAVKSQSQPNPNNPRRFWGRGKNVGSKKEPIVTLPRPITNKNDALQSVIKEKSTEAAKPGLSHESDRFIKPVALQDKGCKSWRTKDGVMVTEINGWEDSENPFEPITMMSRKITVDIQKRHPRNALRRYGMYFVRLANVTDPLNFYLEFITDPPKNSGSWDESLQKFYNQPGVAEKYKLRTLRPYTDQLYAVYSSEEGKWERIRVHGFLVQKQMVVGMYLDRLQPFSDIPVDSLHELHPNFGNWPRHPIIAGLTDIRPRGYVPGDDDDKTHFDWPQDAIDFFKDYTKDKLFRAFIVSKATDRSNNIFHASDEDRFVQVSVYLFEVGAEYQIPVNAWMVQKGYAVPIKSMEGCIGLMETLHGLKLEIETPAQESSSAGKVASSLNRNN